VSEAWYITDDEIRELEQRKANFACEGIEKGDAKSGVNDGETGVFLNVDRYAWAAVELPIEASTSAALHRLGVLALSMIPGVVSMEMLSEERLLITTKTASFSLQPLGESVGARASVESARVSVSNGIATQLAVFVKSLARLTSRKASISDDVVDDDTLSDWRDANTAVAAQMPPSPACRQLATRRCFSPAEVTIVSLVGGPGSGKGTALRSLAARFHMVHISVGQLLRTVKVSTFRSCIGTAIKMRERLQDWDGKDKVSIVLLKRAIAREMLLFKHRNRHQKIGTARKENLLVVIDNFPRTQKCIELFEATIAPITRVVRLDPEGCDVATYRSHMLTRGRESDVAVVENRIELYRSVVVPALRKMLDGLGERKEEIEYRPGTPPHAVAEMVTHAFADELSPREAVASGMMENEAGSTDPRAVCPEPLEVSLLRAVSAPACAM
jgi:UMP-CMP kinase